MGLTVLSPTGSTQILDVTNEAYVATGGYASDSFDLFTTAASPVTLSLTGNAYLAGDSVQFLNATHGMALDIGNASRIVGDATLVTILPATSADVIISNAGQVLSRQDILDDDGPAFVLGGDVTFVNTGSIELQLDGAPYTYEVVMDFSAATSVQLYNTGYIRGTVTMSEGHDIIDLRGGYTTSIINGEDGNDNYYIDRADVNIHENVNHGTDRIYTTVSLSLVDFRNVENLTLLGSEDLNGSGNELDNFVTGNAGNNVLRGRAGDDSFKTNGGEDTLRGGAGTDTVEIDYDGSGPITIDLKITDFQDISDGSDETLMKLVGIENINAFDDQANLYGDGAHNYLYASDYDDVIKGRGGNDTLIGQVGDDVLKGGGGDDIIAIWHADIVTGGKGADLFLFEITPTATDKDSAAEIKDYTKGEDMFDVSALDAIDGGSDDAFTWIKKDAFSGTAGELRFNKAEGLIEADTDGDGNADWVIYLSNSPNNVAEDDLVL